MASPHDFKRSEDCFGYIVYFVDTFDFHTYKCRKPGKVKELWCEYEDRISRTLHTYILGDIILKGSNREFKLYRIEVA